MARKQGELADLLARIGPQDHPSAEELSAYYEHELSRTERDLVQEHIAGCRFCIDRLLGMRNFLEEGTSRQLEGAAIDLETAADWRSLQRVLYNAGGFSTPALVKLLRTLRSLASVVAV